MSEVVDMKSNPKEDNLQYYARQQTETLGQEFSGLSDTQVEESKEQHGSNALPGAKKDTIFYRIRRSFINPFSLVLMVLALISCLVDIILASAGERKYTTFIMIVGMILISGFVRLTQELKSRRVTDRLQSLVDTTVSVKRNGQWVRMEASELVVGDYIHQVAGERVPADIRLLKVQDCFVSESAITGESEVKEKTDGSEKLDASKRDAYHNIAFCGTVIVNGSFDGVVIAVGSNTRYGAIVPNVRRQKKGYEQGAKSIALVLIRFMALLVPLVFLANGLTKGNWVASLLFSLSVAVGLTPELLPMVITACLSKGSYNMVQRQTVVKNINAMQGFGSMDVLCVDKTGTLTEDALVLEYYMDILGNENPEVLDAAYLNSYYHSGIFNHLDKAILKVSKMPKKEKHYECLVQDYKKLDEFPFDYSKKISSVLLEKDQKRFLIAKGEVDALLHHCRYAEYKGNKIEIDEESYASVHAIVDEMLEDGMKVLAIAAKEIDEQESEAEENLILLGYIAFFDAPKKSAASALKKLKDLHVSTKILTGDNLDVALSICRRLGLDVTKSMTGAQLDALSDDEIQMRVEETLIFAELSPVQKAKIVSLLQSNGHSVGFLADGMNDLPAVLASDVGISVDTAVEAVKECADVILLKKDLNILESGIIEGRKAFANMTKYVKITASSNFGNIVAIVLMSMFLPFLPMTTIQILLLNILYDLLCLILPWDRTDEEMIARPLDWSGKDLGRFMLIFGPISSLFDILTFVFLYYYLCPTSCGGMYSTLSQAGQQQFVALFQTGWFLESMWTQILIWYLLRTNKIPFVQSNPTLPVLLMTIFGITLFTVIAITPVGKFIGMTSLPLIYFAFLIGIVLCYLSLISLVKWRYIRRYHSLI